MLGIVCWSGRGWSMCRAGTRAFLPILQKALNLISTAPNDSGGSTAWKSSTTTCDPPWPGRRPRTVASAVGWQDLCGGFGFIKAVGARDEPGSARAWIRDTAGFQEG